MPSISFELNGSPTTVSTDAITAVDFVRTDLASTGTKLVCGTGTCGACVIQVDDVPVASCLLPVEALEGASVTTIEGLSDGERHHPVQRAFAAHDGLQCGFCTPGFVMEAAAFHDAWRAGRGTERPTRDDVVRALAGHLCRCGAYPGIIAAVQDACEGRFDSGPIAGPRVEAEDKLTGRARFTVDVTLPGMLVGRIVRSPLAHAHLVDVDATDAIAMPGVEAFVLLLPSDGRVRYAGEGFAAVAATDGATARHAADAVVAHFVELQPVVGIDAALKDGAPDLHARGWTPPNSSEASPLPNLHRGNLRGPLSIGSSHRFRARKAVADAFGPFLVDTEWEFPAQTHTAFEPHSCVADWQEDRLTVYASTQNVSALRRAIAKRFDLDEANVVVHADHIGGAFGAKQGFTEEVVAAIDLSRAAGRAVRLVFDRHEELEVGGYRPGATIGLTLVGDADGVLPPFTSTSHADGGASAGQVIALFQRFTYPGSPRSLLDYDVLTNAPPGRAMRAPGGPLAFASVEGAVDEYACRLDRDPIELRRSWGADGMVGRLYDWVESRPLWRDRGDVGGGRVRRAVGVAFGLWMYFYDPDTEVEVRTTDSEFVVTTGSQDMGNGTRTALARAVASRLGVDPGLVSVELGTSGLWGPASAGSRTTTSIVPTASAAAASIAARLAERAGAELGLEGALVADGGLSHAGEFIPWTDLLSRLDPLSATAIRPADTRRPVTPFTIAGIRAGIGLTRSAHIAEVEVDLRTGRIQPLRVDVCLAVGKIHVPELAESQVHGGVIQGIGYALHEERLLDPASGLNITTNLDQYRIPGIAEMPETTIDFLDGGFEHSASGSAGLSELATAAVPAAVANAASRAVGHRFTRLPVRPEHVLAVTP